MDQELTVYVVRNSDGEFMRSTGYGGGGKHWVPDVKDAKLYTKIGQARGRVTFWANAYPVEEPPVIVADVPPRASFARTSRSPDDKVRDMRARHAAGETIRAIAKAFDISEPVAAKIIARKSWKHVS